MNYAVINSIKPASIAMELGIKKGDILISINGKEVGDIIDYLLSITGEELEILIRHQDSTETIFSIEKEYDEELGLIFNPATITPLKRCKNNCKFCFISQMPKGLRKTLYVKDDDYRLSFLSGSYITGTNLTLTEVSRIKRLNLSPLYISVHQTKNRGQLIGQDDDFDILAFMKDLSESGICLHTQIVLCPDLNDGDILKRTLQDLISLLPSLLSVAIVPVGLTKFRANLFKLRNFTTQEAEEIVKLGKDLGDKLKRELGKRVIYLSDEFYIKAGLVMPKEEYYDNYSQLENGIGMLRLFIDQFQTRFSQKYAIICGLKFNKKLVVATGKLASNYLEELFIRVRKANTSFNYEIIPVENDFFGPMITVAGLVVGKDLKYCFEKYRDKSALLLIPRSMLQYNSDRFLDDLTVTELEEAIEMRVLPVSVNGSDLVDVIIEKGVV